VAVTAQYTKALPVYLTEEHRQRIKAIADRENISQAQVVRDLVTHSLMIREAQRNDVVTS
jgi:cytidylate kinase